MKLIRRFISVLLCASLVLGSVAPVWANEAEQIEQLRAMLDEQDALDKDGAAATDRKLAREWLQEAEVLVANGKKDPARKRIRRVEFAVELVTALVAAALTRKAAEEQEASAFTAPEQLEQLRLEVEKLRKQKAELATELRQLGGTP